MTTKTRYSGISVASLAMILSISGCDALTALSKLTDCNSSLLTSSDILTLNTTAHDFLAQQTPPVMIPLLTETQAQAVATFLEVNDANCLNEISDLIGRADSDPASVQGLEELAAAFEGTGNSFDPENANGEDLQNILDDVFSGNEGIEDGAHDDSDDGQGGDSDDHDMDDPSGS